MKNTTLFYLLILFLWSNKLISQENSNQGIISGNIQAIGQESLAIMGESSDGSRRKCNEAIYNFVAIDQNRNPISVPSLIPETQIDKQRFDSALRRKQLSLVLAGKLKAEDATELKNALFPNLK